MHFAIILPSGVEKTYIPHDGSKKTKHQITDVSDLQTDQCVTLNGGDIATIQLKRTRSSWWLSVEKSRSLLLYGDFRMLGS